MHRSICTGFHKKLYGPNIMLGGTGRITAGKVNSRPLPSFVHSWNRGHIAFATPHIAICCRIISTERLKNLPFVQLLKRFFLLVRVMQWTWSSFRCLPDGLPGLLWEQIVNYHPPKVMVDGPERRPTPRLGSARSDKRLTKDWFTRAQTYQPKMTVGETESARAHGQRTTAGGSPGWEKVSETRS